jgi:hypothetical protein
MPDGGMPDFGDGKSPDNWNSDLTSHGVRDGQGEYFTADELMSLPKDKFSPSLINDMHNHSDRDVSTLSQHHTLGAGHSQASPGDHIHDGGSSKTLLLKNLSGTYKDISGLFALIPQTAAITGTTDSSGFLVFNHGFVDINGAALAPAKIVTQVHDVGTAPGFGNCNLDDTFGITSTQAKVFCANFNGTARTSAAVKFWIVCYAH